MYLQGVLAVDPSQETTIDLIRPTSFFKKMYDRLTMGSLSKKEETEIPSMIPKGTLLS